MKRPARGSCAVCRRRLGVRTFHDRDMTRRRCPECRRHDPIEMCPRCATDVLVHDVCARPSRLAGSSALA